MSRNGVDARAFAQVPDAARVVLRAGDDVVTVGWHVDAENALQVAFHEHDAAPGAQVPHAPERVHATSDGHWAVRVEGQRVDGLWVAFLVQHLDALLQVPQTPRVVEDARGQEAARRMELNARHPVRRVALHVSDRCLTL